MKKILFPTDFADFSSQALKFALDFAARFNATLVTMHVYDLTEDMAPNKKEKEELANYMLDVLKDFIKKNKEEQHEEVELEYIVDIGLPEKEIVEVALEEDIELIIMGMTGKGKGGGNLFGRTSLDVIGKADCPVLAVPSTFQIAMPENMVYMTDFHFRDIGAINILRHWSTVLDAKVHCLHIASPSEFGIDSEVNMKMLEDCYKAEQFAGFEVAQGDFMEKTNNYIVEQNIGIIATLSRKRGFWQRIVEGSHTRKMAKKISIPILVFKENAYKPVPYPIDFTSISIA